MTENERRLAIKVLNLRRELEIANRMLRDGGSMSVLSDEDALPTFREGRSFWARVRRLVEGGR